MKVVIAIVATIFLGALALTLWRARRLGKITEDNMDSAAAIATIVSGLGAILALAVAIVAVPSLTPDATPDPSPVASESPPYPASAGDTWFRPSDGMTMIYVSAGEFLMGSGEDDSQAFDNEKPQHTVFLDGFWIDKTEVPNTYYRQCVEEGACQSPTCQEGEATFEVESKADHPVVCVNWGDANAYCQWAGARLPTEAEWEKAARGRSGLKYPWGNKFACAKGNFDDETESDPEVGPGGEGCDGFVKTAPVGSFPDGASPYGVLDMAGNVFEWVADFYDDDYYSRLPEHNPRGRDYGLTHVLRSGSFHQWNWLRTTRRWEAGSTASWSSLGFRCAMTATGPQ